MTTVNTSVQDPKVNQSMNSVKKSLLLALKESRNASALLARNATSNSISKLTLGQFSTTASNSRPVAATFVSGADMRSTKETMTQPGNSAEQEKHMKAQSLVWKNPMQNVQWSPEQTGAVEVKHREPKAIEDKLAYFAVRFARAGYDFASGYKKADISEQTILNRAIFLETIAGVPGMCGGMVRHLNSLRTMKRDGGWIHTLLGEAENERMHLLTFIQLKNPGAFFRALVLIAQGVFMNAFFVAYIFNPRLCHRFVGYLEEEAVKTYTEILSAIDDGRLKGWKTRICPPIAQDYWNLGESGTMRDMILAIRADEANHRNVNHAFADLKSNDTNPNQH